MYEERFKTDDFYDAKRCIAGGSTHVGLTVGEQCDPHRPLGHITLEIEPSHQCFVGQGANRDQTGHLSVTPKM